MNGVDPMLVQGLAAALFAIGLAVLLTRRNLFFLLMGIELLLNAANLSFVGFSRTHDAAGEVLAGQVVPLFVIALAAAEACVALAMVICIVRTASSLDAEAYSLLKE